MLPRPMRHFLSVNIFFTTISLLVDACSHLCDVLFLCLRMSKVHRQLLLYHCNHCIVCVSSVIIYDAVWLIFGALQ